MASAVQKLVKKVRRLSGGGRSRTRPGATPSPPESYLLPDNPPDKMMYAHGGYADAIPVVHAEVLYPPVPDAFSDDSPYGHLPPFAPTGPAYVEAHPVRPPSTVPGSSQTKSTPFDTTLRPTGDPCLIAAFEGDCETLSAYISDGYNLKTKNKYGESMLHLAATSTSGSSVQVVTTLIAAGADINAVDHLRRTPLHHACGNVAVLKKLLLHDADVNARDAQGRTPLHLAICAGDRQSVTLLLYNDADKDAQDDDGSSALLLAAHNGHVAIIKLLLSHGADSGRCDRRGMTPLEEARATKQNKAETVLSHAEMYLMDGASEGADEEDDVLLSSPARDAQEDPLRFTVELPADNGGRLGAHRGDFRWVVVDEYNGAAAGWCTSSNEVPPQKSAQPASSTTAPSAAGVDGGSGHVKRRSFAEVGHNDNEALVGVGGVGGWMDGGGRYRTQDAYNAT